MRTLYSGISRGTESLVFRGRVPPSEFERMRAPFQDGDFPAPVKYGYASVGEVEEGPADLAGRVVFALYPAPDALRRAGRRRARAAGRHAAGPRGAGRQPRDGDQRRLGRAAARRRSRRVVGAGTVGCLVAWLVARIPGCEVELVDMNPARADVARALGVRFAAPETRRAAKPTSSFTPAARRRAWRWRCSWRRSRPRSSS